MTNALGTGTVNLSVNVPKGVHSVLGRSAFLAGKSMGEFLKQIIPIGLDTVDPEAAARVREIQRAYYGSLMVLIFTGALLCGDSLELRRARTGVEEVREEASHA